MQHERKAREVRWLSLYRRGIEGSMGQDRTGPDRTGQDITRGLWQIKRGIYEKDRAFSFSFLL